MELHAFEHGVQLGLDEREVARPDFLANVHQAVDVLAGDRTRLVLVRPVADRVSEFVGEIVEIIRAGAPLPS